MSVFLVQADNGSGIMDDFSTALVGACRYQNWYSQNNGHTLYLEANGSVQVIGDILKESITAIKRNKIGVTPVGSIKYVQNHMEGKLIKPINVPLELCNSYFTKRKVSRFDSLGKLLESSMRDEERLFVKSDTQCKTNITGDYTVKQLMNLEKSVKPLLNEKIIISSMVDIQAEWRVFVFNGEILDVRQYMGDWQDKFKGEFILDAVEAYKDCPPAYTLDVGLLEHGGMIVVEVHNFISCGLYGFNDLRYLPQMFTSAYKYELNRK